jgi:hypothetical protein
MCFGRTPLTDDMASLHLRVAFLIATDLGLNTEREADVH